MGIRISDGAQHVTVSGVTRQGDVGRRLLCRRRHRHEILRRHCRQQPPAGIVDHRSRWRDRDGFGLQEHERDAPERRHRSRTGQAGARDHQRPNPKFEISRQCRPGIEIAGKRGRISKIELTRNMFKGNRPILVENAPRSSPRRSATIGRSRPNRRRPTALTPSPTRRHGRPSGRLPGWPGHALRGEPGDPQAIQMILLRSATQSGGRP